MTVPRVTAHVLCFHSRSVIRRCVDSLLHQQGIDLVLEVTDQSPDDSVASELPQHERLQFFQNQRNLGFCGGHNQAVFRFLKGPSEYLLIVNPDLFLEPECVGHLVRALDDSRALGMATPLLLRAHPDLTPALPARIDAAGMMFTPSLRHFDRLAGEERGRLDTRITEVFGGTGACLLLSRACVQALLLDGGDCEKDVEALYPDLAWERNLRALLFDEGFFAYREDADLAWRSVLLGWRTVLVPRAVGWHVRRVTPERRQELPAEINRWSVRNRFLLQINNLSFQDSPIPWIVGAVVRNAIVIAGVFIRERSSIPAFYDLWLLYRRALRRRAMIFRRATADSRRNAARWLWGE